MISIFVWCLFYVLDHKEQLHEKETIISLSIMGLVVLLVIPIVGLTGFHMILVSRGRTTNEQVSTRNFIKIMNIINKILFFYRLLVNFKVTLIHFHAAVCSIVVISCVGLIIPNIKHKRNENLNLLNRASLTI